MKKTNYYIPLLFIALSFFMIACQEEIDLELNNSFTRLVVEGNISSDSTRQQVKLTTTSSYFSNGTAPMVSGARIQVLDGSSVFTFTEDPSQAGVYISDQAFSGKSGVTYELKIEEVNVGEQIKNQSYTASETMRFPMYADSMKAIKAEFFGITGYRIFGFAQEPASFGDFYLWRYYINGKLITDTINEMTFANDELVNGNYINNLEIGFITEGTTGDTLTVETISITENYFNFIISFLLETEWSGGGGFSGPPANIETNISNGAVGYFNTEARTRVSTILP
jgi:hypothetical protein